MRWDPTVLAVDPDAVNHHRDVNLLHTVPDDVAVHHVSALPERWTRPLGLGGVGYRSLLGYVRRGSQLIRERDIDLVYFSTTEFPVVPLGRYWKARHGVPYVIDMQDPWAAGYYVEDLAHRPLKFRLAYGLNRLLEPIAMNGVDGIISVSEGYCDALCDAYDAIHPEMCTVLPFGAAEFDFEVLDEVKPQHSFFDPDTSIDNAINVVYVGRGGHDMHRSANIIFDALRRGLSNRPDLFARVRLHFIGTSYAPAGEGEPTFAPVARQHGVGDYVDESPDRVPYFTTLQLLRDADLLLLPGSSDANYTASKLYPYILACRPLLAVFHEESSVVDILQTTEAGRVLSFGDSTDDTELASNLAETWTGLLERLPFTPDTNWSAFEPYTAEEMTRQQAQVFDRVVDKHL
jgi:hypothetical protein